MTRGQLPQGAGSLGLNGGGAAAGVPPPARGSGERCELRGLGLSPDKIELSAF